MVSSAELMRGKEFFVVASWPLPGVIAATDARADDQTLASAESRLRYVVDNVRVLVAMQVKLFKKGFISLRVSAGIAGQRYGKPWQQSFRWTAAPGQKPM